MNLSPRGLLILAPLMLVGATESRALIVRSYDAGVHKRLLNFPKLVYQVTPTPNPNFIADASLFRGIGWPDDPYDWTRQMALVSPRHLVYSTHYTLTPTWRIIFVGSDGNQHLYGIGEQRPVINNQGEQTDLMIVTLTTAVDPALGIQPFPVLNLANEAAYAGKPLLVCGSFVDSGTSTIGGHITLTNDPGFDTTRFMYFDYDANAAQGQPNDCSIWYGDSGAPSFVMTNGQPAIVGTASGFDDLTPNDGIDGPAYRNFIGAIPSYLPQLDALMEPEGYHLKRFYPSTTNVVTTITPNGTMRRMKPGGVTILSNNSGTAAAHNLEQMLTFQTAPSSVSGAGWICEAVTPLVWRCRRGGIANATSEALIATWASLPDVASLPVSAARSFDGTAPETLNASLPLLPGYDSWIQGTSDPDTAADPDHDGCSNLIEYAFGGAPAQASAQTPDGRSLAVMTETVGNSLVVRFPRRTDAAARGLAYDVEYSTNASHGSWISVAPAGTSITVSGFTPDSPGFEQVNVSVPVEAGRRFVRVKISLNE